MNRVMDLPFESTILRLAILFLIAWVVLVFSRQVVLRFVAAIIRRSPTLWDDSLLDQKVLHRLAMILPLMVVYQGLPLVSGLSETTETLLSRLTIALMAFVMARVLSSGLGAINQIYTSYSRAKARPIKGVLQVVSIAGYLTATILAIAALIDRSPLILLSGLGALTAVGMLVFRDTLLSLVAGIQITTNGLIRIGDWIEMPQFNADGDVIDISLNTIQVQNWDKTITSVPAHKFLENSFKNWRGMQESGGRRIKRSIHIDLSSVRFLTEEEVDYFQRFYLLRDYIAEKRQEIADHNRKLKIDSSVVANVRQLTNVGTLRAYITRYLRQHPGINQEMTVMVRQLQPTAEGLPIELYAFSKDVRWVVYEGVQSDVFDHIFAVAPFFGIRIFQSPTGHDLSGLRRQASAGQLGAGAPTLPTGGAIGEEEGEEPAAAPKRAG